MRRGATTAAATASVPRLALTRREAAEALGMGVTSFEQYVQPQIRAVRQGKLRLFPVSELQRWLDEHAAMALDERV
jgi:excisionase family DNA binding protein